MTKKTDNKDTVTECSFHGSVKLLILHNGLSIQYQRDQWERSLIMYGFRLKFSNIEYRRECRVTDFDDTTWHGGI